MHTHINRDENLYRIDLQFLHKFSLCILYLLVYTVGIEEIFVSRNTHTYMQLHEQNIHNVLWQTHRVAERKMLK